MGERGIGVGLGGAILLIICLSQSECTRGFFELSQFSQISLPQNVQNPFFGLSDPHDIHISLPQNILVPLRLIEIINNSRKIIPDKVARCAIFILSDFLLFTL